MAPTVVLLHAFPVDKRLWDGVAESVADSGWDVVVPDLHGFGESVFDPDESDDEPSLALMAQQVLDILDRIGVQSAVIAGLSLGGYVAMELVRQDPARVAGLVLVDTKASADTEGARANRLRVAEQVLEAGSTDALARAMLPGLLGATTHETRPDVVETVRSWVLQADPEGVAWAQRAMAVRPDSHADLAALAVPALVVWGTEDTISPRAEQETMLHSLRDARLVEIAGAGHLTAVEDPAAVTTALVDFLAYVQQAPRATS
jgi:pimeloyl-ACP methyl ester carboxylesterase